MLYILLILLTFNHNNHKEISCEECHSFKNPKTSITTDQKNCKKCHKTEIKYSLPFKIEYKVKFDHNKHNFQTCLKCHDINEKGIVNSPNMDSCLNCHKDVEKKEPKCDSCHHYYQGKFRKKYRNWLFLPKNHKNYNFKNNHKVYNQEICLECHIKKRCIDCHTNRRGVKKYHPIDYLSTHRYEKKNKNCKSCHESDNSCQSCHQKVGLDAESKYYRTYKRQFVIHPKNWENNHAKAARENIDNCVTCHTENSCMKCHKSVFSPHKSKKDICKRKNVLKNSCKKCHSNLDSLCK